MLGGGRGRAQPVGDGSGRPLLQAHASALPRLHVPVPGAGTPCDFPQADIPPSRDQRLWSQQSWSVCRSVGTRARSPPTHGRAVLVSVRSAAGALGRTSGLSAPPARVLEPRPCSGTPATASSASGRTAGRRLCRSCARPAPCRGRVVQLSAPNGARGTGRASTRWAPSRSLPPSRSRLCLGVAGRGRSGNTT